MSTFELQQIASAMDRQTHAMQNLTDSILELTVTNQKVLAALMDVALGDEPDEQPRTDLDGNPI